MKNKILFFPCFLLFLFVAVFSQAQTADPECPITPDWGIEPTSQGWNAGIIDIIVQGTENFNPPCTLRTKYCYRTVVEWPCEEMQFNCSTYQQYVYDVLKIGDCSILETAQDVRNYAANFLWNNPPNVTIPPCNFGMYPRMKQYLPACYEQYTSGSHTGYRKCPGENSMCFRNCMICDDGSAGHFNCTQTTIGNPSCIGGVPPACFFLPCP